MASEMVKRVAEAIALADGAGEGIYAADHIKEEYEGYWPHATKAIAAMRKPTPVMGALAERIGDEDGHGYISDTTCEEIWCDMIDAALKE
jgi:hypothetical protein